MGRREQHLREIVASKYTLIDEAPGQALRNDLIQSPYNEEIVEMYKKKCTNQYMDKGFGGVLENYPTDVGAWDVSAVEGFHIELDEEQHFNRYRSITLGASIYQQEKLFSPKQLELYKRFCAENEHRCPHTGGWWSNISADRQFGPASFPGDFTGNGSSRWKQRAFYDFIKDVLSRIEEKLLIRISVYDTFCVNGHERFIGRLLNSDQYMDYAQEVLALIEERLEWRIK